ncbi:MAG: 3-methylornithine--L-lysine ligase PylC [Defluviitaleaceae bacterium]|nr:3-methylornithine--L-lysine ligase PylC [Defluviitaleaceae bacterium]
MKIVIIGGKLQGLEVAYLAKKAGWASVLVDKNENPPAKGMCDDFLLADVCEKSEALIALFKNADFILPALEDDEALSALCFLNEKYNFNMAFDFNAYAVTSSKKKSDALFRECGIPAPVYYPGGSAPYIAKPACGSGSAEVKFLETAADAGEFLNSRCHSEHSEESWVVQEYLSGRAYSIEVIGEPGRYRTYQITEIHVDEDYDCRMVTCPCVELTVAQKASFSEIAVSIAERLQLRGIMDVEAILSDGVMKVLEIDARFPSQTPTAVYHSSGVNLIEELFREKRSAVFENFAAVEHIEADIQNGTIREIGEGLMSQRRPLRLYKNCLGADEIITDAFDSIVRSTLRFTVINSAETEGLLREKRELVRNMILKTKF